MTSELMKKITLLTPQLEYLSEKIGAPISVSFKKNKKYMFVKPNTNRLIHFGHYDGTKNDYLLHKDEKRRKLYLARASKILTKDKKKAWDIPYSPAFASKFLWL